MFLHKYHKNSFGNIGTGGNWVFSYPDGILGTNQDFPEKWGESLKIGVVGQSEISSVKLNKTPT